MQLTYNNQSLLATGCYEKVDSGVTNFGREVIKEMNRVGVVIDMSHSAEKSTLDAIELSEKPIAITHANPVFWHSAKRNKSTNLLKVLADTKEGSGLRFNDGKCDPSGRFWVGSMDRKEKNKLGSLYSWNSIEGLVNREQGVTVSNGMGWSPDNSLFYYIDSPTREVSVYDFDLSTGSINNKRRFISFSEEDGFPDGMTIDNEGRLWIAFWGGSKIMCVNPDSKAIEEVVSFPVSKITSCAFGGEKMDKLFITSAKVQVNEKNEPMAGKTFVVSLGVQGLPSFNLKLI